MGRTMKGKQRELDMYKIEDIVRDLIENIPIKQIARKRKISKNTVKRSSAHRTTARMSAFPDGRYALRGYFFFACFRYARFFGKEKTSHPRETLSAIAQEKKEFDFINF